MVIFHSYVNVYQRVNDGIDGINRNVNHHLQSCGEILLCFPISPQVWPALFTLADHGQWPNGGELDMLEYVPRSWDESLPFSGTRPRLESNKHQQTSR